MKLSVNGNTHDVDAEPEMPLLWVLRDLIGLTGSKYGCGIGLCGACTVLVNGQPVRSCSFPAAAITEDMTITTIEGVAQGDTLSKVQEAWIEHQVPQCGDCQSGLMLAATALLAETPAPTDAEIDAKITNICRCGSYPRIRAAIHAAAKA
jgi:isoquinoline 1-oxidoreductase alpha subunit